MIFGHDLTDPGWLYLASGEFPVESLYADGGKDTVFEGALAIRWVAVRGGSNDWAVYTLPDTDERSSDPKSVALRGHKLTSFEVQEVLGLGDDAMKGYRR